MYQLYRRLRRLKTTHGRECHKSCKNDRGYPVNYVCRFGCHSDVLGSEIFYNKNKCFPSFLKKSHWRNGVLTGIDMFSIWFLENGQRNAHILTLKAIAEILKMDVKDFI